MSDKQRLVGDLLRILRGEEATSTAAEALWEALDEPALEPQTIEEAKAAPPWRRVDLSGIREQIPMSLAAPWIIAPKVAAPARRRLSQRASSRTIAALRSSSWSSRFWAASDVAKRPPDPAVDAVVLEVLENDGNDAVRGIAALVCALHGTAPLERVIAAAIKTHASQAIGEPDRDEGYDRDRDLMLALFAVALTAADATESEHVDRTRAVEVLHAYGRPSMQRELDDLVRQLGDLPAGGVPPRVTRWFESPTD